MNGSVLAGFPWQPGDAHRDAAAEWVMDGWARHLPEIPLRTSLPLTVATPAAPWCKAEHVQLLLEGTDARVVVLSDVDVWVDPAAVRAAVEAVEAVSSGYLWAVPHLDVHRLTEDATRRVTGSPAPPGAVDIREGDHDQPPYPGHPCGGLLVARADVLRDVPLDRRYVGWGHEDDSWAMALGTLVGPPWRDTRAPLTHLWHPAPHRRTRQESANRLSVWLRDRYREANGAPDVMRQLVNAGR